MLNIELSAARIGSQWLLSILGQTLDEVSKWAWSIP